MHIKTKKGQKEAFKVSKRTKGTANTNNYLHTHKNLREKHSKA